MVRGPDPTLSDMTGVESTGIILHKTAQILIKLIEILSLYDARVLRLVHLSSPFIYGIKVLGLKFMKIMIQLLKRMKVRIHSYPQGISLYYSKAGSMKKNPHIYHIN